MSQSTFNLLFWGILIVLAFFGWRARRARRAGMTLQERQNEDMIDEMRRIRRKIH